LSTQTKPGRPTPKSERSSRALLWRRRLKRRVCHLLDGQRFETVHTGRTARKNEAITRPLLGDVLA